MNLWRCCNTSILFISIASTASAVRTTFSSSYISAINRRINYSVQEASTLAFVGTTTTTTTTTSQRIRKPIQPFPPAQQMSSSSSSQQNEEPLTTSTYINETLDPCVILMKQILSRHASKWTTSKMYSLAQGVVYWKPPPTAYHALQTCAQPNEELHTYCPDEGLPSLLSAIKDKLARENGLKNVNVIVTAGANQAFVNCVTTLLSPHDKAIVFKPYYFNHVMAIQMTRGDDACLVGPTTTVPTQDVPPGYPDLKWLEQTLQDDSTRHQKNIKMVTVVNPGNPTGISLAKSFLSKLVQITKTYNVWLVVDNTYEHFDHIHANADDIDTKAFPCAEDNHVMNIFSFSKGYGMAGFRVGYVVIGDGCDYAREAYRQMLKVQDTIPICTSRISQLVALGALDAGRQWVLDQVSTLDTGRTAILDALAPLEDLHKQQLCGNDDDGEVVIIGGTGAMYVMAKLPDGMDDQELANDLVEKYGVAIIPGSFCGYPGWIRVCYSNLPPEECVIAASRLKDGILHLCCGGGGDDDDEK